MNTKSNWDAGSFFQTLTAHNKLAQQHHFVFCHVSGLEGLHDYLSKMQTSHNFVCVSDIAPGYTEIENSPRTRRVKTVYLAMRYPVDNMQSRQAKMDIMQELFRQFMSKLILEKTKLEENKIFLDNRIAFMEVAEYFLSGCACCYFEVAVDVYTDLRLNEEEWSTTAQS